MKILGVFPVAQQWRTDRKKLTLILFALRPKKANVTWVIKSVPHLLLCRLKNTNAGVKSCFMWCAYIFAQPYTVSYVIMVSKCKNTKNQWKKRRYWTWAAYSYWRSCWKSFEIYTHRTCTQWCRTLRTTIIAQRFNVYTVTDSLSLLHTWWRYCNITAVVNTILTELFRFLKIVLTGCLLFSFFFFSFFKHTEVGNMKTC